MAKHPSKKPALLQESAASFMRLVLTTIILTTLVQPVWASDVTNDGTSINQNLCNVIEKRLPELKAKWTRQRTEYDEKQEAFRNQELSLLEIVDWRARTKELRQDTNKTLTDLAIIYIAFCKE